MLHGKEVVRRTLSDTGRSRFITWSGLQSLSRTPAIPPFGIREFFLARERVSDSRGPARAQVLGRLRVGGCGVVELAKMLSGQADRGGYNAPCVSGGIGLRAGGLGGRDVIFLNLVELKSPADSAGPAGLVERADRGIGEVGRPAPNRYAECDSA